MSPVVGRLCVVLTEVNITHKDGVDWCLETRGISRCRLVEGPSSKLEFVSSVRSVVIVSEDTIVGNG